MVDFWGECPFGVCEHNPWNLLVFQAIKVRDGASWTGNSARTFWFLQLGDMIRWSLKRRPWSFHIGGLQTCNWCMMYMMYIKECCLCLCLYYWSGNCSFGSRSQVKWTSSNLLYFFIKQKTRKQHPASNKVKSQPGEPLWQEQGMVDGRQWHSPSGWRVQSWTADQPQKYKGSIFLFQNWKLQHIIIPSPYWIPT